MSLKYIRISSIICILIFYTFLAYGRNMVWIDEYSLCYDIVVNSPNKVRPHVNFGNVLLTAGLPDKAIREYKLAIEKDQRYFGAYIGLGGAYLSLKKWDEARAAFNEAVSIQPDSSIAHTNLGLALMNMKLLDKSIAEYKIAIRLWPDNDIARQNLSLAYEQSGLPEDAGMKLESEGRSKQQTNMQDIHSYGNMQK